MPPLGIAKVWKMNELTHRYTGAFDRFLFGAAYYPEHWSVEVRAGDPEKMRAAGFNVVRLGEFAWDRMEPQPGVFDFRFFDAEIARLKKAGIDTIFCTPTASPPRWLLEPEMLRVNADGVVMQHGSRQHACTTNAKFRALSRRITHAVAEHFKNTPAVIAFQTDNEFHCHFQHCYCPSCQEEFRTWLAVQYDSIDALNEAWGCAFWAQTYHSFAEIELPRDQAPTWPNPGAMLDMRRFHAAMVTRFQREQVEILRAANPAWLLFHNGLMGVVDYRSDFTLDLDAIGFDTYPGFVYNATERPFRHAYTLDRARSIAGNFIIPEHQSGYGGQPGYVHSTPEPGEVRQQTFRSIARGADSLLYFRWRSCRFGAEEYWGGILDHDNVPRRRYREIKQVGSELAFLAPLLKGTEVFCDVAIAAPDLITEEIHRIYPMGYPSPGAVAYALHTAFARKHYAVGLVDPEDDLSLLKVFYLPHWEYISPKAVKNITAFVQRGGTLLIGARSGIRTCDNRIIGAPFPGILTELAGCTVEEYGKLHENDPHSIHRLTFGGNEIPVQHHYEVLKSTGADVVARWSTRFLAGEPAVTRNRVGAGCVYYFGTYFTPEVLAPLLPSLAVPILAGLPPTAELYERRAPGRRILFLLNHGEKPLDGALLPGKTIVGAAGELPPYGVKITEL